MKTNGGASWRGVRAKYVAVAWIVLLELIAAVYLYDNPAAGQSQNPFVIPTSTTTKHTSTTTTSSTTTTTHPPVDHIAVESAMISNDTLSMKVKNEGPSATDLLTVTELCSPRFKTCYNYKSLAGAYYKVTFVLPADRTFVANLSGVCVIAIPSCKFYLPVANATYYLQVKFSFADGTSVVVPVSAMANNTWSKYYTAIMGISPSLEVIPANLTGVLNVTVTVNGTLPYASFTTLLRGHTESSNSFSATILTNATGCTVAGLVPEDNYTIPLRGYNYTTDCSQGTVEVLVTFSTVLTGIAAGPYYLLAVHDTTDIDRPLGYPNCDPPGNPTYGCSSFALWVQAYTNSTA
jgi:hypothetical protein